MAVLVTQGNTKRRVALRQTRNIQTTVDRAPVDQVYPTLVQLRKENEYNIFEFPFPPANLQYTSLTPEWVEVNRPGYVPLTGLAKYKLMRIQFEFLIAAPFDGIKYSVEEELNLLRNMANSIQPVYFNGMDSLTNTPIALPGASRTSTGMFFRITDFTITSMRRNPSNQITAAQCSMALQEDFSLAVNAVTMPAIEYPPIMKPRIKKDKKKPPPNTRCTVGTIISGACNPCDLLAASGIVSC